jgi:serine-type D-Ala-D-Ala carboxypeptidase/endopeptidase (penicillin-binding protein 4)
VACAVFGLAGTAAASLRTQLERALTAPGVSSSRTGAAVFDLSTSSFVYRHNTALALKPASNEKLPVAVAALTDLGPLFRIPTQVLGEGALAPNGVWQGRLVLKGYGDPSLTSTKLRRLARAVVDFGIRRVTGPIVGDETYFDRVRTAPGWKPSYYKVECPPLSALISDRGHVGSAISSSPALAAVTKFKKKLRALGVAVPGRAKLGRIGDAAVAIGRVRSPYVATLVRSMNRRSDNFYAEMLLKELGAVKRSSGTTSSGIHVVRNELRGRGVTMTGLVLADGSGLSAYDRLTARAVTKLLISAMSDSTIGTAFVASLPLAGVNGTLVDRMTSPPAYRNVRAKTGTTDSASALSGYVRKRYVFSILMNGSPIPWWNARRAQDRFAQVLAAQ